MKRPKAGILHDFPTSPTEIQSQLHNYSRELGEYTQLSSNWGKFPTSQAQKSPSAKELRGCQGNLLVKLSHLTTAAARRLSWRLGYAPGRAVRILNS